MELFVERGVFYQTQRRAGWEWSSTAVIRMRHLPARIPQAKRRRCGSKTWKTATFALTNAVFSGSQNGGADFRLTVDTKFYIRRIEI